MEYKNQHWVTESYLKAWCDSETPNGAWVWVISKSNQKISRKSPKSLFSDDDFYTFKDNKGNRNLELEHNLKEIEDRFILLRDNKLQKHISLTPKDRETISLFAATMYARTKRQKEDGKQIWLEYIEMVENLPAEISNKIKNSQDYKDVIRLHKDQPMLFHLFQFINVTVPYLFLMNCAIYETRTSPGLITSDNPCFWFDPAVYDSSKPLTYYGVGSPTLNVIFPISPKQYISLERGGIDGYRELSTITNNEEEMVDTLNRLMVMNCEERIVVSKKVIKQTWFDE